MNKVISIEHDREWYNKVKESLEANGLTNVNLLLREPELNRDTEEMFISENGQYQGFSFEKYIKAIDIYPDEFFDMILIDGRARKGCFKASCSKIRKGGIIVWDNTERQRYRMAVKEIHEDFSIIELPGPTPFSKSFTITTLFIRK